MKRTNGIKTITAMLSAAMVFNIIPWYNSPKVEVRAEGGVETIASPGGVTMNLFDYSLYYTDADGNLQETEETTFGNRNQKNNVIEGRPGYTWCYNATSGINYAGTDPDGRTYMHALRFFAEKSNGQNSSPGDLKSVSGYVQAQLVDGYPVLSDYTYTLRNVYGQNGSNGFYNIVAVNSDGSYRRVSDPYYVDMIDGSPVPDGAIVCINPSTYNSTSGECTAKIYQNATDRWYEATVVLHEPYLAPEVENESLAYLFDPSIDHDGKVSYTDVQELLTVDEDGYYSFDYADQRAVFNPDTNSFEMHPYENSKAIRGFFPFTANEVTNAQTPNHYFGLHMQIEDFSMPANGKVLNPAGEYQDMIFTFVGDDDVWIYIDGYLVADLGGAHGASSVTINFATGEVTTGNTSGRIDGTNINTAGGYTLKQVINAIDSNNTESWNGNTFAPGTYHTMDFFYLERGNNNSRLDMRFNMISTYDFTAHKSLIGDTLQENQFHYILRGYEDADGNPAVMPASYTDPDVDWSGISTGTDDLGNYQELTVGVSLDGNANFGDFNRGIVGEMVGKSFRYTVEEVIPDGAIECADGSYLYTDPDTGVIMKYDGKKYYFTGYLYEDEAGDIWVSKWYYTDDTYTTRDTSVNFMNFTNSVGAVAVTPQVTKSLIGRDWNDGEEYEFTLFDSEGTALDTVTADDDETLSFKPLAFTEEGTFTYTISETSDLPRHVTKSDDIILTVTVARNTDTGKLEATPEYSNNDQIINTYSVAGTAQIGATKNIVGREWLDGEQFELVLTDENGQVIDSQFATKDDPTVVFDEIDYTMEEAGEHTYTISEPDVPGYMDYSGDLTVVVTATDNTHGGLDINIEYTNGDTITNTYTPSAVNAAINVTKTIEGFIAGADRTFQMVLKDEDGTDIQNIDLATTNGSGSASFDPIQYTEAGEYHYTVTETEGTAAGFTYDTHSYDVTVSVTDDGHGTLTASISYGGDATAVDIVNTFAEESIDVTLGVIKNITDESGSAQDGTFTFELLDADNASVQTITVDTTDLTGAGNFDALTFTEAGDYTYTVRETAGGVAGMNYDETEYQVIIHVTDNFETAILDAAVEVDGEPSDSEVTQFTFTNVYRPAAATAFIQVTKRIEDLSGSPTYNGNVTFEFTLANDDGEPIDRQTITGAGSVSFAEQTYIEVGEYQYTITETAGEETGYTYDTNSYPVTVNVTDNGEGALEAAISYGDSTSLTITNTYDPENATVGIHARSEIDDRTGSAPANPFEYELVDEEGNVVGTANVNGGGYVVFDNFELAEVGTYNYTIRQIQTPVPGFTLDDSEFSVQVVIADDGTGRLRAEVAYPNGDPVFTNIYQAAPCDLELSVAKVIDGENAPSETFTFNLIDADNKTIQTKTITGEGEVSFDPITFTTVGEYTYFVFESEGDAEAFTYDGARYRVMVAVEDNNGQLEAYYVLAKIVDDTEDDAEVMQFTNTYAPTDTPTPTPTKPADVTPTTPADEPTVTPATPTTPADTTITPTPADEPDDITPTPDVTITPTPSGSNDVTPVDTPSPTPAVAGDSRDGTPTPTGPIGSTGEDDTAVIRAMIGISLISAAALLYAVRAVKKRRQYR